MQGAFAEHLAVLANLGVETLEIRNKADAERQYDGLVLPGGESTAQAKLLHDLDIFTLLQERLRLGLPVFGTCAGMILLAKKLENDAKKHFATMDVAVRRNAFGRQSASFIAREKFAEYPEVNMPFIRAPYITSWGENVKILAKVNGLAVAAQEKNMLITAFHPEVTTDTTVHSYFLQMINKVNDKNI